MLPSAICGSGSPGSSLQITGSVTRATVAAGAGGLAGGFVGGAAMAIGSRWASDTGEIHEGSPNVTF
ncbi:hypothetical protein MJI95_39795, partial [Salmonella enterica subsp. enterica serovar Kentucky]|nr:hypothetical protein [Salmonella enterica subsp. enterica serovar Kentucky]